MLLELEFAPQYEQVCGDQCGMLVEIVSGVKIKSGTGKIIREQVHAATMQDHVFDLFMGLTHPLTKASAEACDLLQTA